MPQIIILPHVELCPEGAVIEARTGVSLCDNLLEQGIEIDHACEKSCACTTCHVIVREGYASMAAPTEQEEDLLDKAWGLEPRSRLSCQAIVSDTNLVIELPKYSINMAKEGHHQKHAQGMRQKNPRGEAGQEGEKTGQDAARKLPIS